MVMSDESSEENDKKLGSFFSSNFQAWLDRRIVEMEAQEINLVDFSSSLHSSMSY